MGAWGYGPFENDDALDWLGELVAAKNWRPVEAALAAVAGDDARELGSRECSAALAACEMVAAKLGRPLPGLPSEASGWLATVGAPDTALPDVAREAIAAIRRESELRDLWEETDDFAAWCDGLEDLKIRLRAR